MPIYLKALYAIKERGDKYVSSVALAEIVRENPSVVKKDLSIAIKSVGKPKVGYEVKKLIEDVEDFLGYNNVKGAVLVGVGKLGQALLGYPGFAKYGLDIVAGFDVSKCLIGREINGKKILASDNLAKSIKEMNVKIGILTTPKDIAQEMADELVKGGVRAIWNFTPCHLDLPQRVTVKNEDMASSLAILSKQLEEILSKE
jgi:redox-sensing transcriptional repressor